MFSAVCGYTLGEYIRRHRLSLAGSELACTDTALKYGYDTPESFSRAFVRFRGVPPSAAKHGAALKSFSRLSVKLTLHGGTAMDYRIEKKEAFDVVLMKKFFPKAHEITTREIAKFWGDCQADRTIPTVCKYIHKPNIFDSCIIGVSFDATNATQNSDFPYGIGVHYVHMRRKKINSRQHTLKTCRKLCKTCRGKNYTYSRFQTIPPDTPTRHCLRMRG